MGVGSTTAVVEDCATGVEGCATGIVASLDGVLETGVSLITGLSATALLAASQAELIDEMSRESETAGFLKGFSGTFVLLEAKGSALVDEMEAATCVLADESADESDDMALETAVVPEGEGTLEVGGAAGRAGA